MSSYACIVAPPSAEQPVKLVAVPQQATEHAMLSCQRSKEYLGMTELCILDEYKHVLIALLGLATVFGLTELASTATSSKLVPKMLDDAVHVLLVMAV